ncbi:phospholipase D-like domain-containing protein [Ramlibacter tataouinensis]|uniref:phospholipase D-like domain-containing protein n=1 Tax=Ramlibacter tataouinensis TaxID=94132 RepID=UPI00300DE219
MQPLRPVLAIVLALAALLAGCVPLPPLADRPPSPPVPDTAATVLGRGIGAAAAAHPGRSGVLALARGHDAFAARIELAAAAERTLDVQYYIWQADLSGTLLMDALRQAADRGVQVRLLLDDNNTVGLDPMLAALAAHPRIEVRLFNPFAMRSWRWLGYLVDFSRLNRRMHNKSFTADRHATVVGGRNVGDSYFDARGGDVLYVDLDVLAVGPVAGQVASDFDRYWIAQRPCVGSRRGAPTWKRSPARTSCRTCWRAGCRWNGCRCACSATTQPRRWAGRPGTTSCGCSSRLRWSRPASRWAWSRPTSCRPNGARLSSPAWPGGGCGCRC